jgi:hypothetical protein
MRQLCSIGSICFRVSAGQIQACLVMTGLLAGPLTDAAGLGAVRADLAGVGQQVVEPARVWLRISPCDRDWLNRDRRWRERSQTDRGFDRQPMAEADTFGLGVRHGGASHSHGARTGGRSVKTGEVRQPHPHLLAHEFHIPVFVGVFGLTGGSGVVYPDAPPRSGLAAREIKPAGSPAGDHPGGSASGPTITIASDDPHRRA